jgi:hypothetical protein
MAIGDLRHWGFETALARAYGCTLLVVCRRKGKAFENQGKSRKHDPIHHGKHEIEMLMA